MFILCLNRWKDAFNSKLMLILRIFFLHAVFFLWTGAKSLRTVFTKRHPTSCEAFTWLLTWWLQSSSHYVNAHDFKQIVYYQPSLISLFKNLSEVLMRKMQKTCVKEETILILSSSFVCLAEGLLWRWVSELLFLLLFQKTRQTVVPSDIVSVMFFMLVSGAPTLTCRFAVVWNISL